ncbi:Unknown protein [Striga hermonthica]|uniref:Uncharacterized protein n=1 Tax=Striga hermonthica TaxID=68872 RepID=A0A9N7RCH1_STRHE|nr:Unknown protein [Striga hermonthica]
MLTAKNTGGEAMAWFDEVFPPETRVEKICQWIQVAKPYLIAAVVLWLVFRLFSGGGGGKTMKAPGRNYRMRRSTFESNPKGYFSDLRGGR